MFPRISRVGRDSGGAGTCFRHSGCVVTYGAFSAFVLVSR